MDNEGIYYCTAEAPYLSEAFIAWVLKVAQWGKVSDVSVVHDAEDDEPCPHCGK